MMSAHMLSISQNLIFFFILSQRRLDLSGLRVINDLWLNYHPPVLRSHIYIPPPFRLVSWTHLLTPFYKESFYILKL